MQGNFRNNESRGLSSVWNPGTHDPQPSSDAPTRPESNPGRPEQYESFVPAPSLDIPDFRVAPRFHTQRKLHRQHGIRTGDPPGNHPPGNHPPVSPTGNLPEEETDSEDDILQDPKEIDLGPEKTQLIEVIYSVLRSAGLEIPNSALAPISAREVIAAVAYFFKFVSPLPKEYTADVRGTSELMRLLGYSESQLEIDMIALRVSPGRKSTWPLIVDMLAWLLELTAECREAANNTHPDDEDWLANLEEDEMVGFEKYFEFAQANAFLLLDDNIGGPGVFAGSALGSGGGDIGGGRGDTAGGRGASGGGSSATLVPITLVSDEYLSEIRETLKKYRSLTDQATHEAQTAINQCKDRTDELNHGLSTVCLTSQRVQQLKSQLHEIESAINDLKTQIGAKQQEVSARQENVDRLLAQENEAQQQLQQLRDQFVGGGGGETSVEQAVAIAGKYRDLQARCTALKSKLQTMQNTNIEKYERPARQQLTAIRIGIEDYNSGTDARLQFTSQLPHSLSEVWGRSMQSLLGVNDAGSNGDDDGDDAGNHQLDRLKSEWERLKTEERKAYTALEDDVAEMEADIARMRSDTSQKHETEGLQRAVNQLENELTMINESIANIEHQTMRRKERVDHCKLMLTALQKSMVSLEFQRARFQEKRDELAPQMKRCIEDKQRYERLLVEYQNAYSLLHDKIEQFERAKAGLLQTKLDSERWVRDLKPTTILPVENGGRKRIRALMESTD